MTDTVPHIDMTGRTPDVHVDTPPLSSLQALADELGAVDPGTVTLKIDSRPGWAAVYSLKVDGPQLAGWRRAAKDDRSPTGFDDYQWQRTILAALCREVRKDGVTVLDSAGQPVTFHSAEFQALPKVPAGSPSGATEAVRKFYANDFAAGAAADAIVAKAGFGKTAETVEDPTPGSSSV